MSEKTNNTNDNNSAYTNKEIEDIMFKIIEHEQHKMWFDYDALFKKTKSVVLKQDNNIEVDHTNFEMHLLARDCISNREGNYTYYVNNILNGDIITQYKALENMAKYARDLFFVGMASFYNEKDCQNVPLNYKLLCSTIVAFNNYLPEKDKQAVIKQYLAYTNGITPDFIKSGTIPESLSDITKYIKLENKPCDNEE